MVRLGEVQAESDFFHGEVGEKQVVLHLLQEALFQQMHCREAELAHHRLVERHTADAHHFGIVRHTRLVADVLFQELLVLVGIVIQGQGKRQVEPMSVNAVEQQEELIEVGDNQVVAVGYRIAQFLLHLL